MTRKKPGDLVNEHGHVTEQELETALAYQRATGKPLGEVFVLLGIATEEELQQDVDASDQKADPDAHLSETRQERVGEDPTCRNEFEGFVTEAFADIKTSESDAEGRPEVTEEETRPVIGMVRQILMDAAEMRASDIHIEPCEGDAEIRYRIDGRLLTVREIPKSLVRMVVARVKILAGLDTSNHRVAEDGRVELREGGRGLDLRISVLPTRHGSRVAIRLLDRATAPKPLNDLGFKDTTVELFRDLVAKPYGIVLVTGPAGSGKTTTLYGAINEIQDDGLNIMTCEDPIEYDLKGVSQSQIDEKAGVTFASQIRAILRQDPDVILVGEIRDRETAEAAVRAALAGHLVLSALHANDAASAIPRLIDMGIEPHMLINTLIGVVAQRLLRILCPECRIKRAPTKSEHRALSAHGYGGLKELWSSAGCRACNGTGYFGRVAVQEVLPVTEEIAELIVAGASAEALRDAAKPYGFHSLAEDALERVAQGETSLEEVLRVVYLETLHRNRTPLAIAS